MANTQKISASLPLSLIDFINQMHEQHHVTLSSVITDALHAYRNIKLAEAYALYAKDETFHADNALWDKTTGDGIV